MTTIPRDRFQRMRFTLHYLGVDAKEWNLHDWSMAVGAVHNTDLPRQQHTSFPSCHDRSPWSYFEVYCTRALRHRGRHAAGDGERIIAVWRGRPALARDAGRASLGTLVALMLAVVFALAVSVAVAPPAGADGRTVLAVVLALVALAVLPAASRRQRGVGQ